MKTQKADRNKWILKTKPCAMQMGEYFLALLQNHYVSLNMLKCNGYIHI